MNFQAMAELHYYLQRHNDNALVNIIVQTWEEVHLDHSIKKVFLCLKPVLYNI